jgi:hypothetical protein
VKRFSETTQLDSSDQNWADEYLDEELKKLLTVKINGAYLSVDLTAHIEYFYNTLDCDNRAENPFRSPSKYQALMYQVSSSSGMSNSTPVSKVSLIQLHQQTIFPQSNLTDEKPHPNSKEASSFKSTNDSGPYLTPINKKYNWYPNFQLASPMKTGM